MAHFEIDFEILKNADGHVCGCQLVAEPHTESETLCSALPRALADGTGDLSFEKDEIVFQHPKHGRCAFMADADDIRGLETFLSSGGRLKIEKAGFLTPGFKIVAG